MTPRERVLSAFRHVDSDLVPLDLSGHRSSGISALLYSRLRAQLGLPPKPTRIYDPIQQLAIVDEDVLDKVGVDTIELGRAFAREDSYWTDWVLPDGSHAKMPIWAKPERESGRWVLKSDSGRVLGQMPDGALYFEQTYHPLADDPQMALPDALNECLWTAIASPPGPITSGADGDRLLRDGAVSLRESTDRAIIGLFGGNLLETGEYLFGMDSFLAMLAGEPERAHAFLDALTEHHLANLERFLAGAGDSIDVIMFGDDLGMQTGPLMSPAMYREFFKPRHRAMWMRAKELSAAKVELHCCGGVRELLPDLIDAGLDAINPVQTSCAGMEPEGLKRDFGNDIVLWGGGCDTQQVLPFGTPEEVTEHVRERIRVLSPSGGFVFQQVHNIVSNVPPENAIAMLSTVREGSISSDRVRRSSRR